MRDTCFKSQLRQTRNTACICLTAQCCLCNVGEIPSPSNAADVTDALRVAPSLDINPLPPELVQSARSLLRGAADAATPLADPQRPQLALQQLGSLSAAGSSPAAAAHPLCGVAYALVVDHGLRPESRAEAAQTAETVARWGLQPVLLTAEWPEGRPSHGQLMSAARAERQRLFRQACQQHGIMDLLVAHQAGAANFAAGCGRCTLHCRSLALAVFTQPSSMQRVAGHTVMD